VQHARGAVALGGTLQQKAIGGIEGFKLAGAVEFGGERIAGGAERVKIQINRLQRRHPILNRGRGVVNQIVTVHQGFVHDGIEAAFGAPVAAALPLSEDILRNGSETVLVASMPDHPVSRSISAVAERL
jgi:hypothetical protein